MTTKLHSLAAVAASAVLLLSLAGCASTGTAAPEETAPATSAPSGACEGDTGVTVVVDDSALDGADAEQWCIEADQAIAAADVLAEAGIETEGTDQYGDQVVCRVNGLPAEDEAIEAEDGSDYFEACETMPAAFAYWSLWVQPAGGEWGYAQEGLSTLQLEPGDAVALLFTLHGEPAAPTS